jgi:uncharacterized phage-associated protein
MARGGADERPGPEGQNLTVQKIVYFCNVWSLIELGRPLIRHKFEAWEFGPVLPYLYREFKNYDHSPCGSRHPAQPHRWQTDNRIV